MDDEDTPVGRVDYVLRAIRVPAGKHKIVMRFDPQSVHVTEAIAYAALALLVLLTLGYVVMGVMKSRKK